MKKKLLAGVLSLLTVFTCAVTSVACSTKDNHTEQSVEQTATNNQGTEFSTKFVNTKYVKLMAATPMVASTTTNSASQTLVATVYPTTASNKTVDWSVAWADSSKTEAVTN
jgi:hypothetical protein